MFGSPPSPNLTGAAREQAAASRQLTGEQTYANRPDIFTPWGSMQWTPPEYDPWFPGGQGGQGGPGTAPGGSYADKVRDVLSRRNMTGVSDQGGAEPGYGQEPGRWSMRVNLSPEQQAALESQQRVGAERSGLAEDMMSRVRGELGRAPDFSNLPEFGEAVGPESLPDLPENLDLSGAPALPEVGALRDKAQEALYGRSSALLDPEWKQREEALDVQLANQGILPGSAAYNQAKGNFERSRAEAYTGARREAIIGGGEEAQRQFGMGLGARQQAVGEAGQRFGAGMSRFGAGMQRAGTRFGQRLQSSEYQTSRRNAQLAETLQRRGWSLNEINALLSGQQVGAPQFPGFTQAGVSQPPNLLGAAQAQYGADLNSYNARMMQLQALMAGGGQLLPFMF